VARAAGSRTSSADRASSESSVGVAVAVSPGRPTSATPVTLGNRQARACRPQGPLPLAPERCASRTRSQCSNTNTGRSNQPFEGSFSGNAKALFGTQGDDTTYQIPVNQQVNPESLEAMARTYREPTRCHKEVAISLSLSSATHHSGLAGLPGLARPSPIREVSGHQ
jgi:hypothetical protein